MRAAEKDNMLSSAVAENTQLNEHTLEWDSAVIVERKVGTTLNQFFGFHQEFPVHFLSCFILRCKSHGNSTNHCSNHTVDCASDNNGNRSQDQYQFVPSHRHAHQVFLFIFETYR